MRQEVSWRILLSPFLSPFMFHSSDNDTILATFEESMIELGFSPSTIVNYLGDLRAFLRWGNREVDGQFALLAVNQEHIRLYRYHLAYELNRAASTINRHMMSLRKFFTFAIEAGYVSMDPVAGVALVQDNGQAHSHPLAGDEVEKLLAAARQGRRLGLVRRDTAILELLLHTGLRVSEIVDLKKDDLIFDNPGVRLRVCDRRDGAKARYLPISEKIYKTLNDYLAVRPQTASADYVFLNQRGHPISDRTIQRIVSNCAKSAGLEGVSAQALRRTFATQLFCETNDLDLVCKRLGHQTPAITAQYLTVQVPGG